MYIEAFIIGMPGYLSAMSHVYFSKITLREYQSEGLWKSTLRKTLVFSKRKVLKLRALANIQNGKNKPQHKISQI